MMTRFRHSPILEKVHSMTPHDLAMFTIKTTNMHATYTSKAQIFVRVAIQGAIFELCPFVWKSALNDPKWPWHVQRQKYQYVCYIHPPEARVFIGFALRWASFRVMPPLFLGKVHLVIPNDMFKVKNTNMYATCTPEAQIFICFTLRWALFKFQPNFGKSAPNDPQITLTSSRSKVHISILHTSPRPKSSSISLYD